MTDRAESRVHRLLVVARRRVGELIIVFVGVYAAFLLNRFDNDRRDVRRRIQLLDAFEQEVDASVVELKRDVVQAGESFGEFDRKLAAGEMPSLGVSFVDSGYSPLDDATLLQTGGLELLDMQTVSLVREVNNLERSLVAFTHDQFELGLVELTNHDPADFYDLATRQLKKRYQWYPRMQHLTLANAQTLLEADEKLLAHLRAARHPTRPPVNPAPSPEVPPKPPSSPAASSPPA